MITYKVPTKKRRRTKNMDTLNTINGIITMLIFIYSLYMLPKAIGETKGVYMEKPEEFYGRFEQDCKWTHGTTYALGAFSYVVVIPVLLIIWDQIMKHMGIIMANIAVIIIIIPFKIYYDKQKVKNNKLAYEKNIEDGYLKETDPMPSTDGRLKKIYRHYMKN